MCGPPPLVRVGRLVLGWLGGARVCTHQQRVTPALMRLGCGLSGQGLPLHRCIATYQDPLGSGASLQIRSALCTGASLQMGAPLRKGVSLQIRSALCTGASLQMRAPLCTGASLHIRAPLCTGASLQIRAPLCTGAWPHIRALVAQGHRCRPGFAQGHCCRPGPPFAQGHRYRSGPPLHRGIAAD